MEKRVRDHVCLMCKVGESEKGALRMYWSLSDIIFLIKFAKLATLQILLPKINISQFSRFSCIVLPSNLYCSIYCWKREADRIARYSYFVKNITEILQLNRIWEEGWSLAIKPLRRKGKENTLVDSLRNLVPFVQFKKRGKQVKKMILL